MKILSILIFACLLFTACNNDSSKTTTDQTNTDSSAMTQAAGENQSTGNNMQTATADAGSADFLMKAADGGMAEVAAGQVAQSKAANESVKMFAGMMVNDHTGANQQVKDLAAKLQVTLPAEPSEEHKKNIEAAGKKEGKAFDKAYMSMMVNDHKKTIALFNDGAAKATNAEVKDFINTTLPKLQMHLDSA
ncbi:MAG: DUF4142 domain-containing protein, partial [Chitinophagaceae bacterium]